MAMRRQSTIATRSYASSLAGRPRIRAMAAAIPVALAMLVLPGVPASFAAPAGTASAYSATPLQRAAAAGNDGQVTLLLSRGAAIDEIAARGATALGWAARNGHERTVRTLLDAGASPDTASAPDRSPLVLAASRDHVGITEVLLERGSKVAGDPRLAGAVLRAIAESGSLRLADAIVPRVAKLFAASPAFRERVADAVVTAADPAVADRITGLLPPASQTAEFETLLLFAAVRHKRRDVASSAIARGADVNAMHPRHGSPLSLAIRRRDPDVLALLLSADADWSGLDARELDQLRAVAPDAIDERRAARLLESIDAIDARDEHGLTLLFRASQRGDVAAVSRLLKMHADPAQTVRRWPDDEGWTALMAAAAAGHAGVVAQLVDAGAEVDLRNGRGRTALALAAFYGRRAVVGVLLRARADPEVADDLGQTPLVLAVAGGDVRSVQTLRDWSRRKRGVSAARPPS